MALRNIWSHSENWANKSLNPQKLGGQPLTLDKLNRVQLFSSPRGKSGTLGEIRGKSGTLLTKLNNWLRTPGAHYMSHRKG